MDHHPPPPPSPLPPSTQLHVIPSVDCPISGYGHESWWWWRRRCRTPQARHATG
ncbi:hypothetical protein BC567DRAFT_218683 [Phyllosticta citribraziliensis]